jgi:hypothetical protein
MVSDVSDTFGARLALSNAMLARAQSLPSNVDVMLGAQAVLHTADMIAAPRICRADAVSARSKGIRCSDRSIIAPPSSPR